MWITLFFMILRKPHVGSNDLKGSQPFNIFVHQYFWNESIDTLDILHGGNNQGKAGSDTTTFGWVSHPTKLQDSLIINIFGMNLDIVTKGRWHLSLPLLIGFRQGSPLSNQIAGLFDLQYFWEKSVNIFGIYA